MSRLQMTRSPFLNFLDLCLTPVSSLKTSLRSDFGRLFIKETDISTKLSQYRVCYEVGEAIYLSSGYNCTLHCSNLKEKAMNLTPNVELDRPLVSDQYRHLDQGKFDLIPKSSPSY